MYSLVIAEDELTTRWGLVNMVKWNELGFRVDGEFSDGQEVLAYLENSKPDVILTDIKMNRVSGLDIAKFVAEKQLPVQVVLLSGYREFSYAQSAVEYHVLHYLLKPVSVPKLREVFCEIRAKLDAQEASQSAMLNREEHYEKLIDHQRQSFVMEAASGILKDPEVLKERLALLDVSQNQPERLLLTRVTVQRSGFLSDCGVQELQEEIVHILRGLDTRLEFYPINWEKSGKGFPMTLLGVFWEKASSDKNAPLTVWKLKEQLERESERLNGLQVQLTLIKSMNNPAELAENPIEIDTSASLAASAAEESKMSESIDQVMSYILQHYCEDITLNDVASAVYLNPIYISRLIKEQTGKGFSEWLMEMRIKKAVSQLKHTDRYVYQIAEDVGYPNLKYFYKVFKRTTGKSPNDYRTRKDGKGT